MDLLALFRHRGNTGTIPPPSISKTFTPRISSRDEVLPAPIVPPENEHPLSHALGLRYEADDGDVTERRVTLHYAYQRGNIYYLQCYCHERKATRCFRSDRILTLVDQETGEVLDSSDAILARVKALASPTNVSDATLAAFHSHRPGIIVLLFLSRCDGEHPLELDVILGYLDHLMPQGIDEELLRRKLRAMHPDPTAYERALNALERTPDELKRIARVATRLVDVDGVISEPETHFALELQRHLEAIKE